mgnify:CR=1 FL=1
MADAVKYQVVENWEQLPKGFAHRDVAGVAVDQEDYVYLMCRGENPVIIYDREGNYKRTWGKGDFTMRTHGIYVAPNGTIFATDDGNHTVRQYTREGRLLMTMGTMNRPSDTGYDGKTTGSIQRAGPPFNRPTNIAIGAKGQIYISDGYGNARVHIFSPTGQLIRSWGEPGDGPGQFRLPHGIACSADGRVWVCDREIDRIQNPETRVARSLMSLFNPILYPGVGEVLQITQQELAYLVGLSRQRVNVALKQLELQGAIRIEYGGLRVLNLAALRHL